MKSFISTVAAAATIATIALASTGANASDGTITFNGLVTDTTCSIDAKTAGAADKSVTLPTVTGSTLAAKGATAGTTGTFARGALAPWRGLSAGGCLGGGWFFAGDHLAERCDEKESSGESN